MKWAGRNVFPVGWYVGSYVVRFIELDEAGNDGLERAFLVWDARSSCAPATSARSTARS